MNADNMLQTTGNAFKSPFEDAASCDAAFFTLSENDVTGQVRCDPASGAVPSVAALSGDVPSALLHLRPHHLLCLQTFTGHGYSEEFVRHMTLVKNELARDPLTPVELVEGVDDLCAHCPNNMDGQCSSPRPALFDEMVRRRLRNTGMNQAPISEDPPGKPSFIHRIPDGPSVLRRIPDDPSIPHRIQGTPSVLHGIPDGLKISLSVLEECCPGCEWIELCRSIAGNSTD